MSTNTLPAASVLTPDAPALTDAALGVDVQATAKAVRMVRFNTVWALLERGAAAAANYLTLVFLVRHLPVADVGVLNLSTTFVAPFVSITEFGLSGVLVRRLVERPHEASRTLSSFFTLWTVLSGLMHVAFRAAAVILHYPLIVAVAILVYGGLTLLTSPLGACGEYLNATARAYQASVSNLLSAFVTLGLVLLLHQMEAPLLAIIAMMGLVNGGRALSGVVLAIRHVRMRLLWDPFQWRAYMKQAWPIAGASMIITAMVSGGVTVLSKTSGLEQVAMYGVATRQIPLVNFFPQSLMVPVFPLFCAYVAQGQKKSLQHLWDEVDRHLLLYASTAIVLAAAYASPLVQFVYGPKYASAAPIFVLAMAYSGLYGLLMPYHNLVLADHQELRRFILYALMLPAAAVAAAIFVPRYDALGLVVALLVGVAILLFGGAFMARKLVAIWRPTTIARGVLPPLLSTALALSVSRLFDWPWAASAVFNVSILLAFLAATRQLPLLSLSQEITRE